MDGEHSIGHLAARIYRYSQMHMQNELKRYEIGIGQLHFLKRLYREDGIIQENLASALDLSKATSTRAIRKLEQEGYIVRKRDASDGRAFRVHLTDKGRELEPVIAETISKWTETLLSGFTDEERDQFLDFLMRAIHNASSDRDEQGIDRCGPGTLD